MATKTKISLLVFCLIIALSGIVFITKSGTIENKVIVLNKLSNDDFKGEKGDFYSARIDIINKTDSTVTTSGAFANSIWPAGTASRLSIC